VRKQRICRLDGPSLISRLLRRIGSLVESHGGVDLRDVTFSNLLEAAQAIHCSEQDLLMQGLERYSNRKQCSHPLRGFIGSVQVAEIPPALWPFIAVGQWVHVGKGSTFGMGRYIVEPILEYAPDVNGASSPIRAAIMETWATP
jgi:hypothetical protein